MGKYVIKRLLQLIPVVLGITFLSFAMMRLAGGDAVTYMYENAVPPSHRRSPMRPEQNMVWISLFWYSMENG